MRLIDADELIKKIKEDKEYNAANIKSLIKGQPTAFDIGKVTNEINNISVERGEYSEMVKCNLDGSCYGNCYECIKDAAVSIVYSNLVKRII